MPSRSCALIGDNIDSHFVGMRSSQLGSSSTCSLSEHASGLSRDRAGLPWRSIGKKQGQLTREGRTMTFMMKKSVQAPRQGRSRAMERRTVSCEVLECRQLLSTGMQPGVVVRAMPAFGSGGWESRWIDMAPATEHGPRDSVREQPGECGSRRVCRDWRRRCTDRDRDWIWRRLDCGLDRNVAQRSACHRALARLAQPACRFRSRAAPLPIRPQTRPLRAHRSSCLPELSRSAQAAHRSAT